MTIFRLVTGLDFGRANRRARRQPNELATFIHNSLSTMPQESALSLARNWRVRVKLPNNLFTFADFYFDSMVSERIVRSSEAVKEWVGSGEIQHVVALDK